MAVRLLTQVKSCTLLATSCEAPSGNVTVHRVDTGTSMRTLHESSSRPNDDDARPYRVSTTPSAEVESVA